MKQKLDNKTILYLTGILSLLISVSTWTADLTHLVEECIYCRTERTMIGLIGIFMLLPIQKYLRLYLSLVFGVFGSFVAARQIFNNLLHHHFGMMFFLASVALFILIAQLFIIYFVTIQHNARNGKNVQI